MDDRSFIHDTLADAVDAHVHIKDPSGLAAVKAAGIAAIRDGGTKESVGLMAPLPDGPLVVSAGRALYKRGGYGDRFGVPVEGPEECGAEIEALASAGAGIIKVMASGMVSLKRPGEITSGGFDCDELVIIVETARRCGLAVMAHANGEAAIMNAAAAGVRSIEHGFFMSEAALKVMRERGVFWVPTVGALQRVAGASADAGAFIARTIEGHLAMIRKAFDLGVPLAIGTDCVLPDLHYRDAYESEIGYFLRAHLPHDTVRRVAHEGGRRLLGMSE